MKPLPLQEDNFIERIEKMSKAIAPYAKAKAERVYIENFLRSKKALLMAKSEEKTAIAREQFAYGHLEYIQLLEGLRAAVEIEEKAKWSLEKFKIEFEMWRTVNANERWAKDRI
jgi:hypothetical protein